MAKTSNYNLQLDSILKPRALSQAIRLWVQAYSGRGSLGVEVSVWKSRCGSSHLGGTVIQTRIKTNSTDIMCVCTWKVQ